MAGFPDTPYIYHITDVSNLSSIIEDGGLWSDAEMVKQSKPVLSVGMNPIKQRRFRLPVKCYPHDRVADYVPFYFCPRSIMLFIIHCSNHPDLVYRGGQGQIIHLEADFCKVINWANSSRNRWAFTHANASAYLTEFHNRLDDLGEIDWEAVAARDFRARRVREGKQAEFLVYQFFPWHLIQRIGVSSEPVQEQVAGALAGASHRPKVQILHRWYYQGGSSDDQLHQR
ncbi:MAG: DUF4433 domain-containing protein [Firmicutes bacterium]|nr:DUF4433 domain-containing protein [Bacillota bacterium]